MRRLFVMIAFSVALPSGAQAADSGPATQGNSLICRSSQTVTGSRIRKPRRCKTAEQWRQEDEAAARLPITLQVNTAKPEAGQKQPQ